MGSSRVVVAALSSWKTEISLSLPLFIKGIWEQKHRDVLLEIFPHEKKIFLSG